MLHKTHKTQIRLLQHAILAFIDYFYKIYWLIELNLSGVLI